VKGAWCRDRTDPRGGEIAEDALGRGAVTGDRHARTQQSSLADGADLGEHDLAAEVLDLAVVE
jgi:hypothetical protein